MPTDLLTTPTLPIFPAMPLLFAISIIAILASIYNVKQSKKHLPNTKRVAKKIKSISPKGSRVFSNKVYLFANEHKTIDIVIADDYGVVIARVFEKANEVYGKPKSDNWKIVSEGVQSYIPNPILDLEETFEKIRKTFAANEVYNIPIEALVVFADMTQKSVIYVDTQSPVITFEMLRGFFAKRNIDSKPIIEIKGAIKVFEDISSDIKA